MIWHLIVYVSVIFNVIIAVLYICQQSRITVIIDNLIRVIYVHIMYIQEIFAQNKFKDFILIRH